MIERERERALASCVLAAAVLMTGCSSGSDGEGEDESGSMAGVGGASVLPPPGGTGGSSIPAIGAAGMGGVGTGAAGSVAVPVPAGASGGAAPAAGAGGMMAEMGGAGGEASGMPPMPAGPEDGDPSKPIVSITEVPCGGPQGGFGLGSANFTMDEREMIVTYPCEKHAGAPATFILNLHGTTPLEQHFYQHGYFAAHKFTASHNLIVVTPSSVVQQWGNMDDGRDEPHLMKIIEWVYATLNGPDKFDIRAMWVGGHSWGGGYTARFGCKPELADKVKGLILMSGGGVSGFGGAACANAVSVIISTAEGDNRMPSDQVTVASGHGCGAAQMETFLMNEHTFWPDCDPGFVHANYYMLGKQHATFMDVETVESIVDWIKLSRQ